MKLVVKALHWIFFVRGEYEEARLILRLLRDGELSLGLDAVSEHVESELAALNCCIRYGNPPDYLPTAYLMKWSA